MSTKLSKTSSTQANYETLVSFGKLRRVLNLAATQEMKFLDIGCQQAQLIRELAMRGTLSMSELARATATDPAAAGKAIHTLIVRGWVERRDNPQDRRRWDVCLTKKGQLAAKQVNQIHQKIANRLCTGLSSSERNVLRLLLDKAAEQMDRIAGEQHERSI